MKNILFIIIFLSFITSCQKEEVIKENIINSSLNYFPLEFNKEKTYSHNNGIHANQIQIFKETHLINGEDWFYNKVSYQGGCGTHGYYKRKGNSIFYKQNFSAYPQEIIKMDTEIGDTWEYSTDYFEHAGNDLLWQYTIQDKLDTLKVGSFTFTDVLKIQVNWIDPIPDTIFHSYSEYYSNQIGWIKRESKSSGWEYEIIAY